MLAWMIQDHFYLVFGLKIWRENPAQLINLQLDSKANSIRLNGKTVNNHIASFMHYSIYQLYLSYIL